MIIIMRNSLAYCAIYFLSFLWIATATLELPDNGCPKYFRYEKRENETIGILAMQFSSENNSLAVTFSFQGVRNTKAKITGKEYEFDTLTENHFRFNDYDQIPKLVKLVLNDVVLCETEPFSPPSYNQTLLITKTVFRQVLSYFSSLPSDQPNKTISDDVHRFAECGYGGLVPFQYGGLELERGYFPWLSAIYLDSSKNPTLIRFVQKCSGTLVSLRSVITAAHCVFNQEPSKIRVYVGRHNLNLFPENGAVLKELDKVILHPEYTDNKVAEVDVAILTLNSPVEITQFIRPICIWRSTDFIDSETSEKGSVAGWGIDENGYKPRIPRVVDVETVSQFTCLRKMIGVTDYLTDRTICAGNRNHYGPCLGDSGGGLMIKRNNRWLLRAVISFGPFDKFGCDHSKFVIYCDLAKHIDWVQENVV